MDQFSRNTGIDILGTMPWGTHICLFYRTKADIIEILVPFFKAGLEKNEFCVWITSWSFSKDNAKDALRKEVPDIESYLGRGQMEIISYMDWYLPDMHFVADRTLQTCVDKLSEGLTKRYVGLRIAGDEGWLDKRCWDDFAAYEYMINETINRYKILAICAYNINKCETSEVIDVINNHQLGLIKQDKQWRLAKNAERKRAEIRHLKYQAQLQSLASELSLIEEREKHRIAAELHDRISQSLVVSKIKLESLTKSVSSRELGKTLNEICSTLNHTIEDARSLIYQLSSPVLYELGLEAAIADCLSEEIEKRHGIKTEIEDDKQIKPLDKDIRVLLYRDVKELLCNVVKHSRANKVKISICRIGDQVCISVKDNGVGFNVAKTTLRAVSEGAFGLFSIRERLEQLGGQLKVESELGRGCKVTMMAPLKLQENSTNRGMS
jgi:signal transduction histidine kinase